eukprot:Selendium_serpulae@DN5320_c0_g1_i2.p1
MLFGKSVRYAGHVKGFDDVIIEGSLEDLKFVAYYIKGGKVHAVATMGADPVAVDMVTALSINKMPTPAELRMGAANSESVRKAVKAAQATTPVPKL